MRIHITGFVIWVIWCFFAAWIYNDYLVPILKAPVPVVTEAVVRDTAADSLAKLKASLPPDLLIFFEFNNAEFKTDPQTEKSISDFRGWLDKYPQWTLEVTGHSDLVGTEEFNQELGMKRALAVGKYLETLGIPASRIETVSKGESEPAASYITDEGRSKNRRTVVTIKIK